MGAPVSPAITSISPRPAACSKGLRLTGGSLHITDLGRHPEGSTIDWRSPDQLQDTLEVIDAKPLRYAHAIGIDPAHVAGRAETQLHFKLPLLADLKLDAVEYRAKATISGANLGKIVLGRAINDANLILDVTPAGHIPGHGPFRRHIVKARRKRLLYPKAAPTPCTGSA